MRKTIKSPWTKLGIKIELNTCLTRQVLSEKYCPKKAKKIEMANFFFSEINGCQLFEHKDFKNYIFYIKNKEILLEKDIKNKYFYIKYTNFWTTFQDKYKLNNTDIQSLTQHWLEEALKLEGYKTECRGGYSESEILEESLNSKGYQITYSWSSTPSQLEESLNSKGYQTLTR